MLYFYHLDLKFDINGPNIKKSKNFLFLIFLLFYELKAGKNSLPAFNNLILSFSLKTLNKT